MVGKGPQPPAWTRLAAVGEERSGGIPVVFHQDLFSLWLWGVRARMMEKDGRVLAEHLEEC